MAKQAAAKKTRAKTAATGVKRGPGRPRKEPVAVVAEPTRSRGRPLDPESNMGKARRLFELLPEAERNRKNVVSSMVSLLGFDKNIAGVYYHNIIEGQRKREAQQQTATKRGRRKKNADTAQPASAEPTVH